MVLLLKFTARSSLKLIFKKSFLILTIQNRPSIVNVMPIKDLRQKGVAPIALLLLFAVIGVLVYLFLFSTLPIKDQLLSTLYPKKESLAKVTTRVSPSKETTKEPLVKES